MNKQTQQTLALAGVIQAAILVDQLSQNGMVAQDRLETSLNSLFVFNPKRTEDIYGGIYPLNLGLQALRDIFLGHSSFFKTPVVMRYVLGMFYLEGKLNKSPQILDAISNGLSSLDAQRSEAELFLSEARMQQLAGIYQNTISTLSFRIQVSGNMNYLKNEQTVHKIRSLLLAGIRSAVLWRQLGGKRWHFLIYRKRIGRDVTALLNRSLH